jgi:4-hydroxy-tetrahydrodipicolinate reductase
MAAAPAEELTRIAINGAGGRVGQRLQALAADDASLEVVATLVSDGSTRLGHPSCGALAYTSALPGGASVLVDFSTPAATMQRAEEAAELGLALVIGTTGLEEAEISRLKALSARVPVLLAHNFSLGVNLLCRIAAEVARALGDDFDVEIVEAHHNRKVDAPSGTAMGLARAVAGALGRDVASDLRHGRQGRSCKRTPREIGMHALRMGSVVGEHTVHFGSEFERVELTHRASNRDVFAAGALRACKWIDGRSPGWYTMDDVLFG